MVGRKQAGNWLVILAAALMFVPRAANDSPVSPLSPGTPDQSLNLNDPSDLNGDLNGQPGAPRHVPDACPAAECAALSRPANPMTMGSAASAVQQLGALGILMALSRMSARQHLPDGGSDPGSLAWMQRLPRPIPPDPVRRLTPTAAAPDLALAAARRSHRGPPAL